MNLKKSDKMIAGIAVLVLIIAAVGIVLYSEDKDDVNIDDGSGKMKSYPVEYDLPMGSATPDNENYKMTDKKAYTGIVDIGMQNVKSITFYFEYSDSFKGLFGFGFLNMGKDTITIKVMDMDDNEIGSETIKGSGNATIMIDGITDMISTSPIEAKSDVEAEELLEERYEDNPTNVTYKVKVTVKYGELRILKKIRERMKGDSFTMEVNYDYYDYDIGTPDDEYRPTGNKPSSDDYTATPFNSIVSQGRV